MKTRLQRLRKNLPPRGSVLAYAVAVGIIVLGILVRTPLDAIAAAPLPPFITLYPAIVFAAFVGGVRVGLASMVLSAFLAWAIWIGPAETGEAAPARAVLIGVYLFAATVTVLTSGLARQLLDDAAREEQARDAAARESVHRIKNLLAIVQSMSRKVARYAGSVEEYRTLLDARLNALAVAQDVLLKRDWGDVALSELISATLAPFTASGRLELRLDAKTNAPTQAVTQLSMALYELATNSIKYGALANPEGHVRVETRIVDGLCTLDWREIGLGSVALGESAGLGSGLIRAALLNVEGGQVRYTIHPQHVSCVFEWPI